MLKTNLYRLLLSKELEERFTKEEDRIFIAKSILFNYIAVTILVLFLIALLLTQ